MHLLSVVKILRFVLSNALAKIDALRVQPLFDHSFILSSLDLRVVRSIAFQTGAHSSSELVVGVIIIVHGFLNFRLGILTGKLLHDKGAFDGVLHLGTSRVHTSIFKKLASVKSNFVQHQDDRVTAEH